MSYTIIINDDNSRCIAHDCGCAEYEDQFGNHQASILCDSCMEDVFAPSADVPTPDADSINELPF